VTEALSALQAIGVNPNPVAVGVATLIAALTAIGLLFRTRRQNIRSDALDKAQDIHREQLQKTVDVLRERVDKLEQERREETERASERLEALTSERNAFYKLHIEVAADIRILQAEMAIVKIENERLRLQNDMQAEQLRHCDQEGRDNLDKIHDLEQRVHELQEQAHTKPPSTGAAGEKVSGTVLGTMIKVEDGKHGK
jgi:hypothetical protein